MDEVICSERGIELIKKYEGLHDGDTSTAILEPCRDPIGLWTLGWGSIFGIDGHRVTAAHRAIGFPEADELFFRDITRTERCLLQLVQVDVSENEWAAICSLTYNIGSGNFQSSTLRSRLNRDDRAGAADEFLKWVYAKKRKLPGLIRRRAEERALFIV